MFGLLRILRLEATGSNLPADEIAKLFDPDDLPSLGEHLERARIDSLRIPQLVFQAPASGGTLVVRVEGLELTGLRGGSAANIAVAGLSGAITVSMTAPQTVEAAPGGGIGDGLRTGRISIGDADLGFLVGLAAGSGRASSRTMRPLLRSLDIESISMSAAAFSGQAASLAMKRLRLRPLQSPLSELARSLAAPTDDPDSWRTIAASVIDAAHSVAFDSIDIRGLRVPVLTAGKLQLSQYADGVASGLAIRDLHVPDGRLTVEEIGVEGLDFRGLLHAAAIIEKNPARSKRLAMFKLYPAVRHAHLVGLQAAPGTPPTSMTVARFQFDRSATSRDAIPTAMTWVVDRLSSKMAPVKLKSGQVFAPRAAVVSAKAAVQWDHRTETLTVQDVSLTSSAIADVQIQARVVDAGTGLYADDAIDVLTAVLRAKLEDATVSIKNHGIVGWLLPPAGEKREAVIDQMRGALVGSLGDRSNVRSFADALATFLRDPHGLTIRIKAPEPIGLADVQRWQQSRAKLDRLDLQATTFP